MLPNPLTEGIMSFYGKPILHGLLKPLMSRVGKAPPQAASFSKHP
jgi:hypothetical protein